MDQILEWYGEDNYAESIRLAREFWSGQGRIMFSMNTSLGYYRQVFDDNEIISRLPENLKVLSKLPGVNPPSFYPDFGTVSTAKYWGGDCHFDSTGGNIFIEPIAKNIQEALSLTPLSVDDPEMDAAHALRLYRLLCEQLSSNRLWMRTPDFQGALNTAGLILSQEELFVAMYSDPDAVHTFIDRVCSFLIDYVNYLKYETENMLCGSIWPYTFIPSDTGMSFTEDLMPLFSSDTYREFGIPCLRKFAESFGSLHIHCCGNWGHHASNIAEAGLKIAAMEFHYPFTRIEELTPLANKTVFIPFISVDCQYDFNDEIEYYRWLIENTDTNYRYWFVFGDDSPAYRQLIEDYS